MSSSVLSFFTLVYASIDIVGGFFAQIKTDAADAASLMESSEAAREGLVGCSQEGCDADVLLPGGYAVEELLCVAQRTVEQLRHCRENTNKTLCLTQESKLIVIRRCGQSLGPSGARYNEQSSKRMKPQITSWQKLVWIVGVVLCES